MITMYLKFLIYGVINPSHQNPLNCQNIFIFTATKNVVNNNYNLYFTSFLLIIDSQWQLSFLVTMIFSIFRIYFKHIVSRGFIISELTNAFFCSFAAYHHRSQEYCVSGWNVWVTKEKSSSIRARDSLVATNDSKLPQSASNSTVPFPVRYSYAASKDTAFPTQLICNKKN